MTDLGGEGGGQGGRSGQTMRLQIFNGRLPPEQSPDRHETLGKRVSDDPRHFIFRPQKHQKKLFLQNFERPFTPQGWLRSASNFGKTRFR